MQFTIDVPEPTLTHVVLRPDTRPIISGRRGPPSSELPAKALRALSKRLSIGGPVIRRVRTESTDDEELRQFLDQGDLRFDFYFLRLTCSLRGGGEPFSSAQVELVLSGAAPGDSAPIAWSMEPVRLYDNEQVSRTLTLSPSLKILGVGLEAGAELGETRDRNVPQLEGTGELESTPMWTMYKTDSTPLQGMYRFHLVVQARKGAVAVGNVSASATVERKRWGLMVYRAAFSDQPDHVVFEISPQKTDAVGLSPITGSLN